MPMCVLIAARAPQSIRCERYPGSEHVRPSKRQTHDADESTCRYQQQVGHIPKGTASRLAALMDKRYVSVEGTMMTGNLGYSRRYKLSLLLDIYGPPSNRDALAPHLAWAGPVSLDGIAPPAYEPKTGVSGSSRSPGKKGKGRAGSAIEETEEERQAKKLLADLEGLDKGEARRDGVMDQLTNAVDVLKLPMHPNPPSKATGTLRNDLLVSLLCYRLVHSPILIIVLAAASKSSIALDAAAREPRPASCGR